MLSAELRKASPKPETAGRSAGAVWRCRSQMALLRGTPSLVVLPQSVGAGPLLAE